MKKNIFPYFKDVEIEDREIFNLFFSEFQPEASEYTFTNLFIWRKHYRFKWTIYKDWLLIITNKDNSSWHAFQPIGPPSRKEAILMLFEWLKEEKKVSEPTIQRCERKIVEEFSGIKNISIEPNREHYDYVYVRDDLVRLKGNRYRSKRNHINKLTKVYNVTYEKLNSNHIEDSFKIQEKWCQQKRCKEDMNLMDEWDAVREALNNFQKLELIGGVLVIDDKVAAFTAGEMLNEQTAVIHIEKADPEIPGLYTFINQKFCEISLKDVCFVNREQDLGLPGLREAKLSYCPHHFIEKYTIRLHNA
ncbi:MAG: phosphatidylglycerol lysyltransferase domain-containing protein [Syntrophorhabdaceae bacterium]|nr:phosphatidylglycerol lysyltransferase domain-containing protein [Syntrophorhabdaceae bacterium]